MNEQDDDSQAEATLDEDVLAEEQPDVDVDSTAESWDTAAEAPSSDGAEESLQGLVTFIVSHLIDETHEVHVETERRGSSIHLHLRVPSDDLGKVIGRQGRVARAMRTALTIAGSRHNVRTSLDIEG